MTRMGERILAVGSVKSDDPCASVIQTSPGYEQHRLAELPFAAVAQERHPLHTREQRQPEHSRVGTPHGSSALCGLRQRDPADICGNSACRCPNEWFPRHEATIVGPPHLLTRRPAWQQWLIATALPSTQERTARLSAQPCVRQSGRGDLNPGSRGPDPRAMPSFATPRARLLYLIHTS